MNENMLAAHRNLGVRALVTLPTGVRLDLGGGDILSFSVEEGADGALLPGAALSARLTLELSNEAGSRRDVPWMGATAQVFVLCGGEELPCGVYIIDSVSAKERSGAISLSGSDSVASELAGAFEDGLSYPATLEELWEQLVAQTRYRWSGSVPGGDAVIAEKPEWGKITLRKAAGWIAQAAGCFVRAGRTGNLELVPCAGGGVHALGPDGYLSLDDGFETFGPVAGVEVSPPGGGGSFTVTDGPGEILTVEGNPLLTAEPAARSLLAQLSGLTLERASFRWRGDPSVGVGSRIALTDTYGQTKKCTVTRQTLRFEGGFSAECICGVPERSSGGVARAITPEGGVNADALVGTVDGGLLRADSVQARSIAAGSITARELAAGSVTADKISAGSVTADHLDADTVSARTAEFVAAEMEKLTASDVDADRLYAAFAHIVQLAADNIAAGSVQADRLSAALADFVSMYAGVGEFDFAAAQNLVSGAMTLEQGAMDTVYIKNLAVTQANMLSATLGKLILKGDDGKYWRVFVGSDGTVSAGEASGEGVEGGAVVETSMNVGSLNATSLQASAAAINQILTTALAAGSITAADALIASATIPALYATSIRALGESLELVNGRAARVHRSEAAPAEAGEGDLWIQPSTGLIYQLAGDGACLPALYMDDGGLLYCEDSRLRLDGDGNLLMDGGDGCALTLSPDGRLTPWQRVKDGELDEMAKLALENAAENGRALVEHGERIALMDGEISSRVSQQALKETADGLLESIGEAYSEISQRADSIEVVMQSKVGGDELRTYIRYEDGTVELGASGSRYAAQISDSGFSVLRDGEVMTSMVRNTVAAPVIEVKRQLSLGGFSLRTGANGHMLLV